MGPKGKVSDEKKQEMFETWKASPQYAAINTFIGKRAEIERIEPSVKDICYDL